MKAIAFDFDGTLIDSMGMWRNLGRNFVESKGRIYTDSIHEKITTMSLNQSSAFFKKIFDLPESVEEIFDEMGAILTDGYEKSLPLKEGSEALLKQCASLAPVALATATNKDLLMPALERFGIDRYFTFIQTCNEVGLEKNDVRFYDLLAERLGERPEDIIFFDDASYAVASAKEAGLYTVGVKDDYNAPYWENIVETADETVERLSDFNPERFF
ncbi:MAG: HAD family phosphatase [Peptoniphilus sp.]|nr:HAD family phosphatase [Peptoniphilus sp.]MDY6045102.1 HAD family phosphatase [Peptoniphilus sp.]